MFLFLPLLAELGFDALVRKANYPGTKIIPCDAALLSLLALKRLEQRAKSDWLSATIDIPKRRQKRIRYLDENLRLDDYDGMLRQTPVTGLGREQPTLFLINHPKVLPREMIMNTVIANSCYKWLASQLKVFEHARPKQLSRKIIETSGEIEVTANRRLRIMFDRRCHNPILREAALDKDCRPIPWLSRFRIEFDYR